MLVIRAGIGLDGGLIQVSPDGRAGIGWHRDKRNPEVIASLSLGAEREFAVGVGPAAVPNLSTAIAAHNRTVHSGSLNLSRRAWTTANVAVALSSCPTASVAAERTFRSGSLNKLSRAATISVVAAVFPSAATALAALKRVR